MATPNIGDLDLSDTEELFASPSRVAPKANGKPAKSITANGTSAGESKYDAERARDEALQKELESVRSINDVIEGVISSLERAKGNMDNVSKTVNSASTLLNTWTRILSQTEHNQRLLLNENWRGASQDLADMETETVLKAQAAERRAAEEERRREEMRKRAEDEERVRQAGTVTRGSGRGRGRGVSRGGATNTGYVGVGGQGSASSGRGIGGGGTRGGSGIGRGVGTGSNRGRGVR